MESRSTYEVVQRPWALTGCKVLNQGPEFHANDNKYKLILAPFTALTYLQ